MSVTPLLDQFTKQSPNPTLTIGVVHAADIDGWFFHSMMDLLGYLLDQPEDTRPVPLEQVLCVRSGPALQLSRGQLANVFLEKSDSDVLLMLDADMKFKPATIIEMWRQFQALPKLNGPNAKILGGLAFIASSPRLDTFGQVQPNIWAPAPDGTRRYVAMYEYPEETLLRVGATGAACLMIHREVFEKIAADQGQNGRWFYHEHLEDGDELGEDLSFCRRATDAGYPIYLHTGLRFGHSKPMIVDEDDFKKLRATLPQGAEIRVVGDITELPKEIPA